MDICLSNNDEISLPGGSQIPSSSTGGSNNLRREEYDFSTEEDCERYFDQLFAEKSKNDYEYIHLDSSGYLTSLSNRAFNEFRQAYASFQLRLKHAFKFHLYRKVTNKRVIEERKMEFVPMGINRAEVAELDDGGYLLTENNSMESFLKKALAQYDDVDDNPLLWELLKAQYRDVLNIFRAALYRKFCGNKKSLVWLHCNSNYGKTFLLNIPILTLMVEGSYDRQRIWGDDHTVFSEPLFIFVDEANKFTHEMKSDVYTYRRMYGGTQTIKFGLRVLASANPISDLRDGVDQHLVNRVTKIEPKENYIEISLKSIGINDTNIGKRQYEKIVIRMLIKELSLLDAESKKLGVAIEDLCNLKYQEILNNYSMGLEFTNLEDLVIKEMGEILRSIFVFDTSKNQLEFRQSSTCPLRSFCFLKNQEKDQDEIFVSDVHELQRELSRRLNGRWKAIQNRYPGRKELCDLFGEEKQVRLNTLKQLDKRSQRVVTCKFTNRPRYLKINWEFEDDALVVKRNDQK